jgi:hypothetical protein
MNEDDVVLKVGAEGGDLTLLGRREGTGWLFSLAVNDCSTSLLDDDDMEAGSDAHVTSKQVRTWEEALALLNCYPWAELYPIAVHPDFRDDVWKQVQVRLDGEAEQLEGWRRVLDVGQNGNADAPVTREESSMTDLIASTTEVHGIKRSERNSRTQWLAQFLVAAELTRRDYTVTFTLGNCPVFDMMVRAPRTNESFLVDVKGAANKYSGWWMRPKEQCLGLHYVLVYASNDRKLDEDEFYVMTQGEVNALFADDLEAHPNDKLTGLSRKQVKLFKDHWKTLPK